MRPPFALQSVLIIPVVCSLSLFGCSTARPDTSSPVTEIGPSLNVRVPLIPDGLPGDFFQPSRDTKCSNQVIGYRFVVWLDSQNVAVGFNTSPCFRQSPDRQVDGILRVLVFDLKGALKGTRDLPYLADGNGEVVADGEAMPGPGNTLLVRIESVNLDPNGRQESKSGVRLLNANLRDVAQRDLFLEQTTFVDHDVVTESGSPFGGGHTISILGGPELKEIAHREVGWPAGTMDRKVGERSLAFMSCGQELRPGEYTHTNVVNEGAKFRCALNVLGQNNDGWTTSLQDGDTASIVGLLANDSVVGQIHRKNSDVDRIVIWKKGAPPEALPWLPPKFEGTIDSATHDLSRYATFATNDAHPCNPIGKVLGTPCDEGGNGRWFIFDRSLQSPIVSRVFPKTGRAALAPDGLHYASFEASELRIYSLTSSK
jgi:hypothetical protein